jgi:hypothetical protein
MELPPDSGLSGGRYLRVFPYFGRRHSYFSACDAVPTAFDFFDLIQTGVGPSGPGCGLEYPAAAADAIAAAREMLRAIAAGNVGSTWLIRIGISIHIGEAVAGTAAAQGIHRHRRHGEPRRAPRKPQQGGGVGAPRLRRSASGSGRGHRRGTAARPRQRARLRRAGHRLADRLIAPAVAGLAVPASPSIVRARWELGEQLCEADPTTDVEQQRQTSTAKRSRSRTGGRRLRGLPDPSPHIPPCP